MNIYFQLSAFVYTLITTIVFFTKKKVNTLENYIYRGVLLVTFIEIVIDILNIIVAYKLPNSTLSINISKLFVCSSLTWPIVFVYYIYAITSPKNDGFVISGSNQNFKHFVNMLIITICIIVILDTIIINLPISVVPYEGYLIIGGPALYFSYYCIAICLGVIWYLILSNRINIKQKKYTPVYVYNILVMLGLTAQLLYPQAPVNVVIAAFTTMVVYFTITNPDLQLIEKLNIATQQADAANHAKTDFLSSMSHEIRTPLNAIIGFSQALAKENISGSAKEEVKEILTASNSLLETVNGILDISKIEANKIEIVETDYSIKKLINEVGDIVNSRIGSKVIEFKTEIDSNLPPVLRGDIIRIKQILTNLLSNSVKYTKEGYILLAISSKKIISQIEGNQVELIQLTITIEDSGIGMTKEDLDMIFTKFQRFEMNENVNIQGTGLGMAITKGLVDLMGGTIEITSEYGKGSKFTVTLNQKISNKDESELITKEEKVAIEPFNASGQKVLVVDDNKINLRVANKLLEEYKLNIELVNSGEDCINRIIDGKKYDLIFLDIMMPKMKGPEVLQNLKNIIGFNTPVVALTADVITGMEEKYTSDGFDDCLAKPIVEEELYKILKKYLKETAEEVQQELIEETKEETKSSTSYLEENGINVTEGLKLLKDIEMYNMTIEQFYEELEEKLQNLQDYKDNDDMDNYNILVHSLKTEARYIGCNELADMYYEHEKAAKANDIEYVKKEYSNLKTESLKTYEIIKKYLEK
jgi:signal transduction histidine kinase/CheY-like chemotaxis protein/HPt (histidine-containing phosphotransfer) domain-containing protein